MSFSAGPYELGLSIGELNYSGIYPVYIRGDAYLADGQGPAAAAEFQKILGHRGLVQNCATGALAHLGLARAYVLQGARAPKPNRPIRIFSRSGKTPTPTFQFL